MNKVREFVRREEEQSAPSFEIGFYEGDRDSWENNIRKQKKYNEKCALQT